MRAIRQFLIFMAFACATQVAPAANMSAGNIFALIAPNETTSIDQGGVIHSQARSIYSMGGGMTSFKGKRVSLMAADPPSFSAGCAGISWHFGGFSFISLDEIRQLVESISQASLGIVIDLAMQTLCPQCYAVMSKLRDMANQMRNAHLNSCQMGRTLGRMLWQQSGLGDSLSLKNLCSSSAGETGKTNDSLAADASTLCSWGSSLNTGLDDLSKGLSSFNKGLAAFQNGQLPSWAGGSGTGATPSRDQAGPVGNATYEALTGLGYEDGFVKNILLSMLGMEIYVPGTATDCRKTFANTPEQITLPGHPNPSTLLNAQTGVPKGSSAASAKCDADDLACNLRETHPEFAVDSGSSTTVNLAEINVAGTTNSKSGSLVCPAPPLMTDVTNVAERLLCGFDPKADQAQISKKFASLGINPDFSAMTALCKTAVGENAAASAEKSPENTPVYRCDAGPSDRCATPFVTDLKTLIAENSSNSEYTGVAYMVYDALLMGVAAARNPEGQLPAQTITIINNAGYPLYRLINIAAVYPAVAMDILNSMAVYIAAEYVVTTLDRMTKPGSSAVAIQLVPKSILGRTNMSEIHTRILRITDGKFDALTSSLQSRMDRKRTLIKIIQESNRAMQSEILSTGMVGNAALAASLKKQVQAAGANK